MTAVTPTSVLTVLGKARLVELGRELAVSIPATVTKEQQVERLARSSGIDLMTLARVLTRDGRHERAAPVEDAVIDRLFALNAERAAAERATDAEDSARSAKAGKPKKPATRGKVAKASQPQLNLDSSDE